jgi:hypothetical protein
VKAVDREWLNRFTEAGPKAWQQESGLERKIKLK